VLSTHLKDENLQIEGIKTIGIICKDNIDCQNNFINSEGMNNLNTRITIN
jgi:hypothetical protein